MSRERLKLFLQLLDLASKLWSQSHSPFRYLARLLRGRKVNSSVAGTTCGFLACKPQVADSIFQLRLAILKRAKS